MIGAILAGTYGGGALAGDFESIATYTFTSGSSNQLVFSGISSDYQHLQIRFMGFTTGANNNIWVRFNGDTASNYATHELWGTGAAAAAGGSANTTYGYPTFSPGNTYPCLLYTSDAADD